MPVTESSPDAPTHIPPAPTPRERLSRALRCRCPVCGEGKPFRGLVHVRGHCESCGFRYERERGYFLGSVYFNYAFTGVVLFALHLVLDLGFEVPISRQLPFIIPLGIALPVLILRHCRALWQMLDLAISAPEARDFTDPPQA